MLITIAVNVETFVLVHQIYILMADSRDSLNTQKQYGYDLCLFFDLNFEIIINKLLAHINQLVKNPPKCRPD